MSLISTLIFYTTIALLGDYSSISSLPTTYSDSGIDGVCTIDCFVEGTQVLTPSGYELIETLDIDDEILVYNFSTKNLVTKKISDRKNNYVTSIYEVVINSEIFQVTGDHKFYVEDLGWRKVSNLEVGMPILTDQGSSDLQSITQINGGFFTYNIAASNHDNYVVGNTKIVVHR